MDEGGDPSSAGVRSQLSKPSNPRARFGPRRVNAGKMGPLVPRRRTSVNLQPESRRQPGIGDSMAPVRSTGVLREAGAHAGPGPLGARVSAVSPRRTGAVNGLPGIPQRDGPYGCEARRSAIALCIPRGQEVVGRQRVRAVVVSSGRRDEIATSAHRPRSFRCGVVCDAQGLLAMTASCASLRGPRRGPWQSHPS
jgi:hypothetical protein